MSFSKERFASNLRSRRAYLDLSQEELAKATGLSKDSIVKYESGEGYTPGADKIYALSEALQTSPNELMGWAS